MFLFHMQYYVFFCNLKAQNRKRPSIHVTAPLATSVSSSNPGSRTFPDLISPTSLPVNSKRPPNKYKFKSKDQLESGN